MKINMLTGAPYRPHVKMAEKEQLEKEAEELINNIASDYGVSPDWKEIAASLAVNLLKEIDRTAVNREESHNLRQEVYRRVKQDIKRVENRIDQVDKRAFQEAVRFNIDDYDNKAEAIRD